MTTSRNQIARGDCRTSEHAPPGKRKGWRVAGGGNARGRAPAGCDRPGGPACARGTLSSSRRSVRQAVFDRVVVQLVLSDLQVSSHRGPLILCIAQRLAQRTLGEHILTHRGDELAHVDEDRLGFPLPQFQAGFKTSSPAPWLGLRSDKASGSPPTPNPPRRAHRLEPRRGLDEYAPCRRCAVIPIP